MVAPPAGALSVVEELELGSVGLLLNEEVRESYTVTGGAVAGAGVFGVITTALLPTTWEDLLACAVAGLIGYLAVLNLPLRRAETKGKVKRVATNFSAELSSAMEGELAAAMDSSADAIMAWINPLVEAARREVAMVRDSGPPAFLPQLVSPITTVLKCTAPGSTAQRRQQQPFGWQYRYEYHEAAIYRRLYRKGFWTSRSFKRSFIDI